MLFELCNTHTSKDATTLHSRIPRKATLAILSILTSRESQCVLLYMYVYQQLPYTSQLATSYLVDLFIYSKCSASVCK